MAGLVAFTLNLNWPEYAVRLGGTISKRGNQKMPEFERLKVHRAYEELMKIHREAQREREREAYTRA